MSLSTSLRSEILKTKRTGPLYLTLGAAAFGPLMSLLDLLIDGVETDNRQDIFNNILVNKFIMTSIVALPLFLVLACTLLPQIEYRNNTWKQVFTSPQQKAHIFLSKFINIQFLVGIFLLTNLLLTFLDAVILHFVQPSLNVLSQPLNWQDIIMARVNAYVALLALCTIQFWLGLRFKNFIVPIAIGIGLWFVGTLFVMQIKSELVAYFPYSFHAYGKFPKYDPLSNPVGWTSLSYTFVFLLLGFMDFRKRAIS